MNKNDFDLFLGQLDASTQALSKIIMKGVQMLASLRQPQYVNLIASTFGCVMNDVTQVSRIVVKHDRSNDCNLSMSMG